jgi:hypothetical protein
MMSAVSVLHASVHPGPRKRQCPDGYDYRTERRRGYNELVRLEYQVFVSTSQPGDSGGDFTSLSASRQLAFGSEVIRGGSGV